MPRLHRRRFLQQSAAALAAAWLPDFAAADPATEPLASFFVVGDTHFRADDDQIDQLHERSKAHTEGLIQTLNRLPGTDVPDAAGGGKLPAPNGLLHVGDLVDSGDKRAAKYEAM